MPLKGFGIEKVAALAGVLIGGGFLAAIMLGPLMAAAESGQDELGNTLNQNRTLNIEKEETMASAAHYVRDRAYGCDGVRNKYGTEEGYSGLAGTPYTKYPPCVDSIEASNIGFFQGLAGGYSLSDLPGSDHAGTLFDRLDGGQDMEARHGRIYFTIQEPIELTTYQSNYDDTESDYDFHLITISEETPYRNLISSCSSELVDASDGTQGFMLTFDGTRDADAGDRIQLVGSSKGTIDDSDVQDEIGNRWLVGSDPYCHEKAIVDPYLDHGQILEYYNGNEGYVEAKLCPGDRGYIQVNKNQPGNFGEADSEIEEKGAVGAVYGSSIFPYIQMTHTVDDCDNDDGDGPGDDAYDAGDPTLPRPGDWGDVNQKGQQLHIVGNSETPGKVERIDIDNNAPGDLAGCQIMIEDEASGQVGIVNWSSSNSDPDKATPIFFDAALPPEYEDDSLGHNLDEKDGPRTIYENLRFDGDEMDYELDSNPSGHLGSYITTDDGHVRTLWRDMLCIEDNSGYGSGGPDDDRGKWVMCTPSVDGGTYSGVNYPSPGGWSCVDGSSQTGLDTGWYPTAAMHKESCDNNYGPDDPHYMNGWGETGCAD